jgi:hypothetical protein
MHEGHRLSILAQEIDALGSLAGEIEMLLTER